MQIPDNLSALCTGEICQSDNNELVIDVPDRELKQSDKTPGDTVRVAILTDDTPRQSGNDRSGSSTSRTGSRSRQKASDPKPVDEGDIVEVEITSIGEEGDGIGKVGNGFVVIVPGVSVGDVVETEIEQVNQSFAKASKPLESTGKSRQGQHNQAD